MGDLPLRIAEAKDFPALDWAVYDLVFQVDAKMSLDSFGSGPLTPVKSSMDLECAAERKTQIMLFRFMLAAIAYSPGLS